MFLRSAAWVLATWGWIACVQPAAIAWQDGQVQGGESAKGSKHPPVFSELGFADARARTEGNEKILIVKGTAAWCGPCKQMDRTTWRDERVVQWVKDNGLAIQVDVDEQPKVAKQLKINAMPTMIAFKDGKEVDRVVGFQTSKQLLTWVDGVKQGKTAASRASELVERATSGEATGVRERLSLAQELVEHEKFDEATREYVWLWENIRAEAPDFDSVRGSFMAREIQDLATRHKPAMTAFAGLRDAAEKRLESDAKTFEDLDDWITLNRVVGEQEKTLAWFDRIKDRPTARQTFARVKHDLVDLLKAENRWADYGKLIDRPVGDVRQRFEILRVTKRLMPPAEDGNAEMATMREDGLHASFRNECADVYGALLAANRDDEAASVLAEVLKLDDTAATRLALVERAITVGRVLPAHNDLLDAAEQAGADVGAAREALRGE